MKQHRAVTRRQEQLAEQALCEAVLTLRTPDEVRAFFKDLCTPAELQALADRWSVVGLLQRGLPYREIHKLTGVSVTTIGRVARFLVTGNGGYQVVTDRLATPRPVARSRARPATSSNPPRAARASAPAESQNG